MPIWTSTDGNRIDAPSVIAAALCKSPGGLGRTRLLALDGPAGSGKTTLAVASAELLASIGHRCAVLHMDDFYEGWDGGMSADCFTRIKEQVLKPIRAGGHAHWQRYDWLNSRFAEWNDVPECDVLILEGCGSGSLPFEPYIDALAWIEVDRPERLRRGIDRDGDAVEPLWRQWMRREDEHFAVHRTRNRADLRLTS
jgi:uridine kinase